MTVYRYNQKGEEVATLQRALINLGIELPHYGADGHLGKESWAAIEEYAERTRWPVPDIAKDLNEEMTDEILELGVYVDATDKPDGWVKVEALPQNVHGQRAWEDIDTVVLHQCGVWMTDTPERFSRLKAHIGILDKHPTPIVQVGELTAYMYHANSLNKGAIGIELNGHFPGREGDYDPDKHSSRGPSERQIDSAQNSLSWLVDEVAAHGGALRYIAPHRVSSMNRQSDPGEVAWKQIGLWATTWLGLCDQGPGYAAGGRPIPYDWCAKQAYTEYKY